MIEPTGNQLYYRSTGKKYRVVFASEGWGKTYMLAYDALWYASYPNKRILVITPNVDDFNHALSQYSIIEHDSSEIVVSNDYKQGSWFMVIIDNAETYTEVQLKQLLKNLQGNELLWISSRTPAKDHWLMKFVLSKRQAKYANKRLDWWIVIGEKSDGYQGHTAGNYQEVEEYSSQ